MRKKAMKLIKKVARQWNIKPDEFKETFKRANHIEKGKLRALYEDSTKK